VAEPDNQRVYRAPCPGCGAPVEFRGAQSAFAVCSYCQSTVVRQGDVLSRVGKMAELFDDHSPLQLQASGVWEGRSFTLVGRLQFKSASGTWTEWNAVFDDASNATLGEDNGSYVFSRAAPMARAVPEAARFRVGATTAVGGKSFSVAANDLVGLLSAQGEVPRLPALGQPFAVVELRSADGEVLSIEYDGEPPSVSRGRAVLLETLQLTGLREELVKEERGREFACPHCGAPIEVTLANSKSITCRSCHSLIDLASGTGAELKHALQGEFIKPLIALGTVGQLQGTHWQVVGFQHRTGHDPQEEDAEHFGWDEYLLFNAKRGFTFLVDSEEGWSVVKPVTGAPAWTPGARTASYLSTTYALAYSYEAETTYVAGEFYWRVERGQKTFNRDFAKGASLLSMEQTPTEVTWSSGSKLSSDQVAAAFKMEDRKDLLKRTDASPLSNASGMGCGTVIFVLVVIVLFLALTRSCTSCDPAREDCSRSSGRSSGGSFGGYSSGGGHK
jgi:hypothetical protein